MAKNGYRARPADAYERITVVMSTNDVRSLDAWGVPAGMPSRSEAIRELIRQGLQRHAEAAKENP